jgi:adenosine deaminase
MHTGLIICGIRTNLEATRRAAEIAVNYKGSGVVGFDLAGKERGHRPKTFEKIIEPVLSSTLPVTIHAGEDDTEESIREALVYLNAQRIGHGVSLRQNESLMEYMDRTRVCLETCPTSNIDTGAVNCIDTHPARSYFQRNLRMTMCTDNRTVSQTSLTDEYMSLMDHLGFTRVDVLKLIQNGFKAGFVDSRLRDTLLEELKPHKKGYKV